MSVLHVVDHDVVSSLPVAGHPGRQVVLHVDGSAPRLYLWDHIAKAWKEIYKAGDSPLVTNLHVAPGAQLFDDYMVSGNAVLRGASAPDIAELVDGLFLPAFDGAATAEQVFFTVHVRHDVRNGTNPTFHVHWTHNNGAPSGNVEWNIDYSYADGYRLGTYGNATTLTSVSAATTQYEHIITSDDDMEVTDQMMVDGQIICRLWRDPAAGNDTFEDDAFLIGVDMHYEVGQWGTPERNQPFSYGNAI